MDGSSTPGHPTSNEALNRYKHLPMLRHALKNDLNPPIRSRGLDVAMTTA